MSAILDGIVYALALAPALWIVGAGVWFLATGRDAFRGAAPESPFAARVLAEPRRCGRRAR
ncbi:MAG: hypothetical protein IJS32_01185 [Kiritimatiellae bacterium]|nr:hypothetical protein [Kiritimatiellia bacterium]